MSERMDQARAEAREYARPQMLPVQTVSEHREEAFLDGWRAADANPKPRTITLTQSEAILEAGRAGTYEDHEAALSAAGIDRKSRRVGKECRSRWSPYH